MPLLTANRERRILHPQHRVLEREGASLVTVKQLIDMLQEKGWRLTKSENDLRHYKHDSVRLIVTLSGKDELLVPPGVLRNIRRSTQLEE